jgi:hypothetical protein
MFLEEPADISLPMLGETVLIAGRVGWPVLEFEVVMAGRGSARMNENILKIDMS